MFGQGRPRRQRKRRERVYSSHCPCQHGRCFTCTCIVVGAVRYRYQPDAREQATLLRIVLGSEARPQRNYNMRCRVHLYEYCVACTYYGMLWNCPASGRTSNETCLLIVAPPTMSAIHLYIVYKATAAAIHQQVKTKPQQQHTNTLFDATKNIGGQPNASRKTRAVKERSSSSQRPLHYPASGQNIAKNTSTSRRLDPTLLAVNLRWES